MLYAVVGAPMSTLPKSHITPGQYLEIERKSDSRNEYYNGEIFAMAGASRTHERIAIQLAMLVQQHLRGKRCEAFAANMRILATPANLYTYADLSAACDPPRFLDAEVDTLTNPSLLVEILSPSTEAYDRGKKAALYRRIPSLHELLLVTQDRLHVELQRRQPDGTWILLEADGLDGSIELASIGYTLRLNDLYETAIANDDTGQFSQAAS